MPEWQNVNAFVAKFYNTQRYNFGLWAVWEIRLALEDEQNGKGVTPPIIESRVHVACIWIQINGRRLLKESLLSSETTPARDNLFTTGVLFQGSIGFTLERWGFWKRRLTEVRDDFTEPLRGIINNVVQSMTDLEKEVAVGAFGEDEHHVNGSTT